MQTAHKIDLLPLQYIALSLIALSMAFMLQQTTPANALLFFLLAIVFIVALLSTPIAIYLLIFSMLLSPEFMVGQIAGKGLSGRGLTIRIDDFLLLVIGLSWLLKTAIHKELGLVLRTPMNRPIFYYILACVLATVVGIAFGRVRPLTGLLFTLKYIEYFFIYFMIVNNVRTPQQAQRYLVAALVTACIVSVYAIMQIPGGGRVSAPFEGAVGEPNTLGGYLVLMISIVMGLCLHLKEFQPKVLLGSLGVLMLIALAATLSRSSYLALGAVFFMTLFMMRKRPVVLVVLVVIGALLPVVAPEKVKNRITGTFMEHSRPDQVSIGKELALDTSTSARIISWKAAVRDWWHHPLLGYGVAGYGFIDSQYFKVLVDTGLLGVIAFFNLLYALWVFLVNAYRQATVPWIRGLISGFIIGYMGMLVHAIGANTFIIVRIMEPFWLFAGLVMVLTLLPQPEKGAKA